MSAHYFTRSDSKSREYVSVILYAALNILYWRIVSVNVCECVNFLFLYSRVECLMPSSCAGAAAAAATVVVAGAADVVAVAVLILMLYFK